MSSASALAAKHGNVLVLLNTLYTSGFASTNPTIPMLKSIYLFLLLNFFINF